MNRFFLLSLLVGTLPFTAAAQDDDLYFTPKKGAAVENHAELRSTVEPPTYYSGSNRDVDEYNRRGKLKSYYQKIGTDSLGNDVIEFHAGDGTYGAAADTSTVYPGSATYYDDENDYAYTRRMGMYDDYYGWYNPYYYGYWGGPYWSARYGWYDPWFDGWYDPWFYGSWYGWGSPYWHHYGWWDRPIYGGGGPRYHAYNGVTGTRNHGPGSFGRSGYSNSNFGGYRGNTTSTRSNNQRYTGGTNFGGQRRSTTTNNSRSYSNSDFGRSNNSGSNFGGMRSGSFSGGSSFGGGGGFSGGGSRGGGFSGGSGGGHFGGRR